MPSPDECFMLVSVRTSVLCCFISLCVNVQSFPFPSLRPNNPVTPPLLFKPNILHPIPSNFYFSFHPLLPHNLLSLPPSILPSSLSSIPPFAQRSSHLFSYPSTTFFSPFSPIKCFVQQLSFFLLSTNNLPGTTFLSLFLLFINNFFSSFYVVCSCNNPFSLLLLFTKTFSSPFYVVCWLLCVILGRCGVLVI